MSDLKEPDIRILNAVSDGLSTTDVIRPKVGFTTTDGVRVRSKRLIEGGYLESWLERAVRPQEGSRFGHRPQVRKYKLTQKGRSALMALGQSIEGALEDEAKSTPKDSVA